MRKTKTMDGNTAAAYVSYAYTEVSAIFPNYSIFTYGRTYG